MNTVLRLGTTTLLALFLAGGPARGADLDTAVIRCKAGTKVSGKIDLPSIDIWTEAGMFSVPMRDIREVRVSWEEKTVTIAARQGTLFGYTMKPVVLPLRFPNGQVRLLNMIKSAVTVISYPTERFPTLEEVIADEAAADDGGAAAPVKEVPAAARTAAVMRLFAGEKPADLAAELGVSEETLMTWRGVFVEAGETALSGGPPPSGEDVLKLQEMLLELVEENKDLRQQLRNARKD